MGALSRAYEDVFAGESDGDGLREISESELIRAIELGVVVNAGGAAGTLEEIPDDEDISGRYLDVESDPPLPTAILDGSTLRQVLLRYAGKTRGDVEFDPRGLRLERVLLVGQLNWAWLDLPFPVGFWGCGFHEFFMNVDHARVPRLVFDTCYFGKPRFGQSAFNATQSRFDDGFRFLGCEGLSQLFLLDCDLGMFELREHPGDKAGDFRLVLSGSSIGEFIVSADSEPGDMIPAKDGLDGIRIQKLTVGAWEAERLDGREPRARWIEQWLAGGDVPHALRLKSKSRDALNPHRAQVWAEFARALDNDHLEEDARALRIAGQRLADAHRPWFVRAWRWLTLDVTVRYFYRNTRALGWLAMIWLIVAVLAWFNISSLYRDGAGPAPAGPFEDGTGIEGVLWALAYALDIVVSPLELGFAAVWPSAPALIMVFAVLKLAALTLFGLFITGVSGVVQRRRD